MGDSNTRELSFDRRSEESQYYQSQVKMVFEQAAQTTMEIAAEYKSIEAPSEFVSKEQIGSCSKPLLKQLKPHFISYQKLSTIKVSASQVTVGSQETQKTESWPSNEEQPQQQSEEQSQRSFHYEQESEGAPEPRMLETVAQQPDQTSSYYQEEPLQEHLYPQNEDTDCVE